MSLSAGEDLGRITDPGNLITPRNDFSPIDEGQPYKLS